MQASRKITTGDNIGDHQDTQHEEASICCNTLGGGQALESWRYVPYPTKAANLRKNLTQLYHLWQRNLQPRQHNACQRYSSLEGSPANGSIDLVGPCVLFPSKVVLFGSFYKIPVHCSGQECMHMAAMQCIGPANIVPLALRSKIGRPYAIDPTNTGGFRCFVNGSTSF
jgi:hypothetical protein